MVECITNWRSPDIPMQLNLVYSSKTSKLFKRTYDKDQDSMTLELGPCPVCGDVKVCFFTGNASKVRPFASLFASLSACLSTRLTRLLFTTHNRRSDCAGSGSIRRT